MHPLRSLYNLMHAVDSWFPPGILPIALAAIGAYVAAKAMADALCGGDRSQPGRLAMGHWIPIALLAMAAAFTHQADIAIGLIFSSSIACLSLAIGAVAFLGPVQLSTASRRSWVMLVPAAVMAFLVGIHGAISLFNAGVFALEGLCVLMLWNDQPPTVIATPTPIARPGRGIEIRCAQFVLAIALAGVAAWCALRGVNRVAATSEFATVGLLTATLLGPMLVLPIIGTGTELAHQHNSAIAISSQVGVALLNLCGLLPLVVFAGANHFSMVATALHWPFTNQLLYRPSWSFDLSFAMPFPMAVWRVDVILLIVLGLILMPIALGRWSLTRMQGLLMMLGYLFYLVMTLAWDRYALQGVPR